MDLWMITFWGIVFTVNTRQAVATECSECTYVKFQVSGDATITDTLSAVLGKEEGVEECFEDAVVDGQCSTDGSCYKVTATTSITIDVLLLSGEVSIQYAKRGCNDLIEIEKCQVELETSLESIPFSQEIKDLIPGSTEAEAGVTVDCCASNLCNGPTPPPPPPEEKNLQSQTSSASRGYDSLPVVALFLFILL